MNNTQSHAAGPWQANVCADALNTPDSVCSVNGVHICDVASYGASTDQRHANARLIAAAPELLAALESLASDFRTTTRDCDKWSGYAAAAQAIAKAKGVSHV